MSAQIAYSYRFSNLILSINRFQVAQFNCIHVTFCHENIHTVYLRFVQLWQQHLFLLESRGVVNHIQGYSVANSIIIWLAKLKKYSHDCVVKISPT